MKLAIAKMPLCLLAGAFFLASNALAEQAGDPHADHRGHSRGEMDGGDHSGHDHSPPETSSKYEVSAARYAIPAIELTDQFGRSVRLDRLLAEDRPTLVQFIFTSCTTICPVMGAVFGGAQSEIATIASNYRMVSISIDPEYDTPEKLREFANRQNANRDWVLLTGSAENVRLATKAFDALYQGDNKMYHQPYTFIRWHKEAEWVRIRGLLSVADLVKEFSSASERVKS